MDNGALDSHLPNSLGTGVDEKSRQTIDRRLRTFEHGRQRAAAAGSQVDEVRGLSRGKIADLVLEPEGFGSRTRGQIQHPGWVEHGAVGGDPLDQVRLQRLFHDSETGASADIGAEREVDAGVDVPLHGEHPAAQHEIARRAVGDRGSRSREPLQLGT